MHEKSLKYHTHTEWCQSDGPDVLYLRRTGTQVVHEECPRSERERWNVHWPMVCLSPDRETDTVRQGDSYRVNSTDPDPNKVTINMNFSLFQLKCLNSAGVTTESFTEPTLCSERLQKISLCTVYLNTGKPTEHQTSSPFTLPVEMFVFMGFCPEWQVKIQHVLFFI